MFQFIYGLQIMNNMNKLSIVNHLGKAFYWRENEEYTHQTT